ncbi:hypothetical protein KSS87_015620 [Heliosperma pusillum]|nr:hypothetical protein KSS87_015620 [Heliosperma pusillum]
MAAIAPHSSSLSPFLDTKTSTSSILFRIQSATISLLSPSIRRRITVHASSSAAAASPALSLGNGSRPWKVSDARYQEILTDPSYAGQFVLMTNPHIGNTGVNFDDVDTRAITRRLREDGSLIGVLSTEKSKSDEQLLETARSWDIVGVDLISGVTCQAPYQWVDKTEDNWEFNVDGRHGESFNVVAYDFGVKQNILRRLASYGCKITVVPSTWPASEVLKMKPDGILFSNGPGDPSAVPYAVESVKALLGQAPIFGICMGHQLLGQALGGKTYKMKFGHHGGNHPVRNMKNGQNHNYAVDPATLPEGVEVTHVNLNDGSCAGLAFPAMNIMSLQYHPEASPGPHDSDLVFGEFVDMMRRTKGNL